MRIGFVDGTQQEQDAVKALAEEWTEHDIEVAFDYTADLNKSHVRISFAGGGDQSKVGSDALSVNKSTATMFLPTVRKGANAAVKRRAVLHEFGHGIMTFGHEHRHADAGYKFKDAKTIRDIINTTMLPPGSTLWTEQKVKDNITNPPYSDSRTCSAYDIMSIMHYPVQSSWLLEGVPVPHPATQLSALDIGCAVELYKA